MWWMVWREMKSPACPCAMLGARFVLAVLEVEEQTGQAALHAAADVGVEGFVEGAVGGGGAKGGA